MRIKKSDIRSILAATFPEYKGRTFKLAVISKPDDFCLGDNMWDGGTRSYYAAFDLTSGRAAQVPASRYGKDNPHPTVAIPHGLLIVEHSIFCGQDCGITVHVREDNMAKLLPQGVN